MGGAALHHSEVLDADEGQPWSASRQAPAYSGKRPSPNIVSSTGPGAPSAPNQRL